MSAGEWSSFQETLCWREIVATADEYIEVMQTALGNVTPKEEHFEYNVGLIQGQKKVWELLKSIPEQMVDNVTMDNSAYEENG